MYKERMEQVLVNNIFPEFKSELGYMRARVSCQLVLLLSLALDGVEAKWRKY